MTNRETKTQETSDINAAKTAMETAKAVMNDAIKTVLNDDDVEKIAMDDAIKTAMDDAVRTVELTEAQETKNINTAELVKTARELAKTAMDNAKSRMAETPQTEESANGVNTDAPQTEKYTLAYALAQIERIANDTSAIHQAIDTISRMKNEGTPTGGSAEVLAKSTAEVIRCRETTNQKLIAFYEKMVEDLKPQKEPPKKDERTQFMEWVMAYMTDPNPNKAPLDMDDFRDLLDLYMHTGVLFNH